MSELKIPPGGAHPISAWLDVLGTIIPQHGVSVIGAGSGNSQWVQWLLHRVQCPVLLVEGDKSKYHHLVRSLPSNEKWTLQHQVVAENSGPINFYRASNPAESGLLHPDQLNSLWPNLTCVEIETFENAVTLASLKNESRIHINWLVLDCLPATTLLMGAGTLLAELDVVIARVAFNEYLDAESGGDHKSIDALLVAAGLICIHIIPQRHPALAYAFYIKDMARQKIEQLQNKADIKQLQLKMQETDITSKIELEVTTKYNETLKSQLNRLTIEFTDLQKIKQQIEHEHDQKNHILQSTEESLMKSQKELAHTVNDLHKQQTLSQQLERQLVELNTKINEQANKFTDLQKINQQLTQQSETLKNTEDALTKAKNLLKKTQLEQKDQQNSAEKNIEYFKAENEKKRIRLDELLKVQTAMPKPPLDKSNDTSGFDNFIDDIEPYLFGKSITYVDVGAFVGDVFKFIIDSKKIRVREAHLIEPNPESYENLTSSLQKYRIPSLHTYNMGVSDAEHTLRFSAAASMTKAVTTTQSLVISEDSRDIKCSPFDEFCQFITDGRINLLKIDVEGHEMAVLKGAEKTLQQSNVDIIYIEVGFNIAGTQQAYFAEVDQYLQKFGYRCFKIYEQTSEWIHDHPWLRRCNFAYFSSPFAINNPAKLTLENRRLQKLLESQS